jgi:hypothetical protein
MKFGGIERKFGGISSGSYNSGLVSFALLVRLQEKHEGISLGL